MQSVRMIDIVRKHERRVARFRTLAGCYEFLQNLAYRHGVALLRLSYDQGELSETLLVDHAVYNARFPFIQT
jgi:hypothetical protein